jgi:hypothetical protein
LSSWREEREACVSKSKPAVEREEEEGRGLEGAGTGAEGATEERFEREVEAVEGLEDVGRAAVAGVCFSSCVAAGGGGEGEGEGEGLWVFLIEADPLRLVLLVAVRAQGLAAGAAAAAAEEVAAEGRVA